MKKAFLSILILTLALALLSCNYETPITAINQGQQDLSVDDNSAQDDTSEAEDIIPETERNIARNKEYTYTGAYIDHDSGILMYPDLNGKSLTDGIVGTIEGIGYSSPIWVGINFKGEGAICEETCWHPDLLVINNITVDLGDDEDMLTRFVLFAEKTTAGIGKLKEMRVFISDDASDFQSVGVATETMYVDAEKVDFPGYGIYTYTVSLEEAVKARYVRFEFVHEEPWAFISEIEVYQEITQATDRSEVESEIETEEEQ